MRCDRPLRGRVRRIASRAGLAGCRQATRPASERDRSPEAAKKEAVRAVMAKKSEPETLKHAFSDAQR